MLSGLAAASIAARASGSGPASPSIQSSSVAPGSQERSRFIGAPSTASTSYEQPRPEIEPRREDRPGRDRSDVDVEQPGRRFHRSAPRRLDRGPGHDEREQQPDDQAKPDEERPRPDENGKRTAASRTRSGRDPDREQHDLQADDAEQDPRA